MNIEGWHVRTMTFQIADVTKPLASAERSTAKGRRIVLGDHGAYAEQKHTGTRVKLHKKGNAIVMRAQLLPTTANGRGSAMDIDAFCEPGFTRQED